MDDEKKAYLEEDLTEEDLAVLRLYEEAAEPVPWDESDDAILAMAHAAAPQGQGDATLMPGIGAAPLSPRAPVAEAAPDRPSQDEEDGNVVAFQPRQGFSVRRMLQSPAAGFAMAACLVLGIFAGQGMSPYVNLGVSPDYRALQQENESLRQQGSQVRSLGGTTAPEGGMTGQISDLETIAGILAGFSCADLSLSISEGRGVRIAGHLGSVNDLRRLNAELLQLGRSEEMTRDVRVYDWPLCEALEIVAPFRDGGLAGAGDPALRLVDHGVDYRAGERLIVEVAASAAAGGYLYVDYFQHDGQVRHLLPTAGGPDNRLGPGEAIVLGDSGESYQISAPFGTEMIMVLQSPVPLFGTAREDEDRAQDYLQTLRKALNGLVARGRGPELAVSYQAITTHGDDQQ